jgi:aminoglycoside phosphotransferase (APT) family kinase protein
VVHGDLHPWNVAYGPAATRVFDWTDAAVSHAFVDLATYVFRTNDQAVRRRLIDAHVSAWSTVGSEQSLREAVGLGLVVGALYQVQSYRALLPTLMGNGADDGLAGADLSLDQALPDVSRVGLESPA